MEALHRDSVPGYAARLMHEGDTVILECKSNPHVVDIKFAQLKHGDTVNIAKGKVAHATLIGQPFGTCFEVCGRDKVKPVTIQGGGMADLLLGELGEETGDGAWMPIDGGAPSEGGGGGSRDNRQLLDRNRMTHGRECSQKLGAEEIKEIKDAGKGAKEVMKALIENSDTFKHKTEFSQAKWLKKKAAKHAPQFSTARPSALTLCRAFFRKEPYKINHMREDTLARLLTLSNVQPGSRALVVDSMNGLVLGALAERMGGMGRLMHGFNGMQPGSEAVRWFNLDANCLGSIMHFPLSEVAFVPNEKNAVNLVMSSTSSRAVSASTHQEDTKPMACAVQDKEPEGVVVATSSDGEMATQCWKPEGAKTESAADVMGARQKRIDAANRVALSFDPAVVLGRHTVQETQEELQLGFDSLVVAGSLDVKLLVLPLLRLLKPSSPLVVYSLTPAPLLELQECLIREEAAINLHITESWMREHQVLDGRTHPLMSMNGSSGFLLSGTRVFKKSEPPPSRNAAVRDGARAVDRNDDPEVGVPSGAEVPPAAKRHKA